MSDERSFRHFFKDENPQKESRESTSSTTPNPAAEKVLPGMKTTPSEQHGKEEESTLKLVRQAIIERKIKEADSRGQLFVYAWYAG